MRRRNHTKHVLEDCVERAHLADGLCRYEHHELVCMLASGAPQLYDLTKFAWDEFNLPRMKRVLSTCKIYALVIASSAFNKSYINFRHFCLQ